ncbi:MAG: phosphonate ABC transporter ATP-binding protein [Myxococcales bacterium]
MTEAAYELVRVRKVYPSRAGEVLSLDQVSFSVARGERVAVLGPSGAGKTSLFRLLNATLRPSGGEVRFDGQDLGRLGSAALRAVRRRIGTVFQHPPLVPSLTALQNAMCGRLGVVGVLGALRALVAPRESEVARARAALEAVGLADKEQARADELSGGQQQRVSIARVLVQEPEVVLADEPFASLDPALTEAMAQLLFGAAGGRTLIVTLHDVALALRLFPRVIGVADGRIAFDRRAADVSAPLLEALYAREPGSRQSSGESERGHGGPRAPHS